MCVCALLTFFYFTFFVFCIFIDFIDRGYEKEKVRQWPFIICLVF